MAGLKLRPGGRPRVLMGHPWVFQGEVQKLLSSEMDGELAECRDSRGTFLGCGLYNSRSQIVWRRIFRNKQELNQETLKELLVKAISRRSDEPVRRLVWSESDHLPGLIVDQYNHVVVIQTLTLGLDKRLPWIVDSLKNLLKPESIVVRNDISIRKLEGLEESVSVAFGPTPERQWVKIGSIDFYLDFLEGQKTGFYLDQRAEYTHVAALAQGRDVLDTFCNQGGFALHCAQAGAKSVLGVDLSESAITQARINAEKNGLKGDFEVRNIFDFFRNAAAQKKKWGLIILDPPPFARSKDKLAEAWRGYKELHLQAMRHLEPGGILTTYSCSHHITREIFGDIVADAAADARRDTRILRMVTQPSDHPVLLQVPESEYLNGLILEVE